MGTPQVLSDADQKVVWRAEASPFGETVEAIATVEQNLRFPGQYFDRETQLHYNHYRDYDPSIGRYLQSDPIGLGGGLKTYAYAGGYPYSYADPTGEFSLGLVGAMVGSALPGGLGSFAMQALMNGGNLACISYDEVAFSAAYGAAFGLGGTGMFRLAMQLQRVKKLARVTKTTGKLGDFAHNYQRSVGASQRVPQVLQSGGNKLSNRVSNGLNDYFGEKLTKRDWGRALEDPKKDNGLRNDHHGRILDNGDYINDAGDLLANISHYLP